MGFRPRVYSGMVLCVIASAAAVYVHAAAGDVNTIAGTGAAGFSGDNGPATAAELAFPTGLAVAPDGTIYFSDTINLRIRRITPAGVISTIAGTGQSGNGGDGGPASAATFANVFALALDPNTNSLFVSDRDNFRIRRIDLSTGLIHAFAGSGSAGFGGDGGAALAASMMQDGIATDAAGHLYIADLFNCRLRRVDRFTGLIETIAGTVLCDRQGDGGPAIDASLAAPTRVAVDAAGHIYVIDFGPNERVVRRIDAATGVITTVAGGGTGAPGSGPATTVDLIDPFALATGQDGRVFIGNFTQIFSVDPTTGSLAIAAGGTIPGFAGDGGPAAQALFHEITGLAFAPDGDLVVADGGNHRLRAIEAAAPPSGNVEYIGTDLTAIDVVVPTIEGNVTIAENELATIIIITAEEVGGDLTIVQNEQATEIILVAEEVGGDLTIIDNVVAETIAGPCTTVALGALQSVGGNLTLESCGTGVFSLGNAVVGGNLALLLQGYSSVSGNTAGGTTSIRHKTLEAAMTVDLAQGTFTTPVPFTITHLDPGTLSPEPGLSPTGGAATIDPLAAHHFTFAVPTLNQHATLTFDVLLAGLDMSTQTALLQAIAAGTATLATRGDAVGAAYQSFPVCASGQVPVADGCVVISLLDANGQPASGVPAIVRFSNVVGHFSTWAVAIVTPQTTSAAVFNGLLAPYPAPPYVDMPAFQRGRVIPLKFNWLDATGAVIDSAAAAPSVSILATSCFADASTGTPIAIDDAGESRGLRYDTETRTWIFGWSTRALPAECFTVSVTPGNPSAFASPTAAFRVALR